MASGLGKLDAKGLELAGKFLEKIRTDASFAQKYDSDPAAALQSLSPELQSVPKDKIARVLHAGAGAVHGAAVMEAKAKPMVTAGFLGSIASSFAQGAAAAAGAAAVAAVLASLKEPTPE